MQYEEKQTFSPWVYVLLLVGMAGSAMAVITAFILDQSISTPLAGIIILAAHLPLTLFLVDVLFLTTRIEAGGIRVRLGYPIPLYWKRIALNEIHTIREVTYRPLRDAGGWGIRFGRFEGKSCRFLNARGERGVLIETDRLRLIIGSQTPERLAAALRDMGIGAD